MEFRGNSLNTAHGHQFDERVNVGAVFAWRTMSSTRELLPCIRIHSRNFVARLLRLRLKKDREKNNVPRRVQHIKTEGARVFHKLQRYYYASGID